MYAQSLDWMSFQGPSRNGGQASIVGIIYFLVLVSVLLSEGDSEWNVWKDTKGRQIFSRVSRSQNWTEDGFLNVKRQNFERQNC